MISTGSKSRGGRLLSLLAGLLAGAASARGADQIGDISVSASAIYTGQTGHGYAEARVLLENDSSKPHAVTLSSPHRSYDSGNCIGRVARTVTIAPGATEVVSLLQPPLSENGDGTIEVVVDGRDKGATRLPNANSHCASYVRAGGTLEATALISRSLDADGIQRMLNAGRMVNSAEMAAGSPNFSPGRAWMPDTTVYPQTNWLELTYAPPQTAHNLEIYYTQPPARSGFVDLTGVSGSNVAHLDLATGVVSTPGAMPRTARGYRSISMRVASHWGQEFTFPETREPIKTVRINFGLTAPGDISVAGVALENSTGQYYADTARASSENTGVTATATPVSGRFGSNPDAIECLRAESALADWSDNWLAYTPFDAVFLGAADLTAMPAPVAAAIGDYLQAGGKVIILGAGGAPAAWNPSPAGTDDQNGLTEVEAGFGNAISTTVTDPAKWSPRAVHRLQELISGAARYWSSLPNDSAAANNDLPVVENVQVPVRSIALIMLVFIIIAGPVNMIVLASENKRAWLLWTIPALSVVTTFFIFAYSLLREGITPSSRIAGLTILDQAGHHAATFGATGFYCPLTPSDGLRFDNETEATPLVAVDNYNGGSSREVDWTQTQHFQRGWVSSRVPAHFVVRKSGVRRERLEWQKVNGGWQIINGLGAPIKSLWLADRDMKLFTAENIPAGQPATLAPAPGAPATLQLGAHALFRDLTYCGADPGPGESKYLKPGTYIAVLDGNPFIENALGAAASPKRTRSAGVVYGILDAPATP